MSSPSAYTAGTHARVDEGIRALGDLPVLDRTLVRVRMLSQDAESTTHDLVEALQSDPNLAVNVLRYANSAQNARPVRAATLHQAVMLVGRQAVGRLALEAQVCSFFERAPGVGGVAQGQLHLHAAQVGACAAELARRAGADTGAAHLAGLLHDLGKVVLPAAFGQAEVDAVVGVAVAGPARVAAEQEGFGVDHAWAGARFAANAGLDAAVVEAIALHHDADATDVSPLAACVQAANATVALITGHAADRDVLAAALSTLGVDLADLDTIAAQALPAVMADASPATGLAAQISRLEREARTDDLTDLLNRRYWSIAARERLRTTGASVLICDIDHFKRINDHHGHQTGDFVLSEVARILSSHGLAGRLGGDEFALVTSSPDPAAAVARGIVEEVAAAFPADLGVGVSIGSATAVAPGADLSVLLSQADEALYDAKRAGRGTQRSAA